MIAMAHAAGEERHPRHLTDDQSIPIVRVPNPWVVITEADLTLIMNFACHWLRPPAEPYCSPLSVVCSRQQPPLGRLVGVLTLHRPAASFQIKTVGDRST